MLPTAVVWRSMTPTDSSIWMLGPQLGETFGKDWGLWPFWRSCIAGTGLRYSQLALCLVFLEWDVSFQFLLQCHACQPAVRLTIMMARDSPSETRSPHKLYFINHLGPGVLTPQWKSNLDIYQHKTNFPKETNFMNTSGKPKNYLVSC